MPSRFNRVAIVVGLVLAAACSGWAAAPPTTAPDRLPLPSRIVYLLTADRYFIPWPIERPPLRRSKQPPRLRPAIVQWSATLSGDEKAPGKGVSEVGMALLSLAMVEGAATADLPLATWSCIDQKGELLPQRFTGALPFDDGVAPAADRRGWGLIDETGRWVIEPKYQSARQFSDGLAAVQSEGLMGFIDHMGKLVIKPQFRMVGFFSEGLCSVWPPLKENERTGFRPNNQGGYIDKTGKAVIAPGFHNIWNLHPFADGLAMVRGMEGNNPRYMNREGRVVIDLWTRGLKGTWTFREGMARVERGARHGFIDTSGVLIIPARFDGAYDFSEGSALVSNDGKLWGYIGRDDQWRVRPQFVGADRLLTRSFHDGMARVTTADGWSGFIDSTGKRAFEVPADQEVANFEDGLAFFVRYDRATQQLRWGYLDKSGKPVFEREQKAPEWMKD